MSQSAIRTWHWPDAGATPVNYGLDTEIFDSEKFSYVQTFVREAIQNSLDARQDINKPVYMRFAFGEKALGSRKRFFSDLEEKKRACSLPWPDAWGEGRISWLVVEDSNSSGLQGDLTRRDSDFWNYWLNFGISNKTGEGRGGRGIGRITFLIASGISTVIGITRRAADGQVAACGMSLLKPGYVGDDFKTSYAYLAPQPEKSIYRLYSDGAFLSEISEAFETTDYVEDGTSGLSLIIPYPHKSLSADGILASAIEHFAPAIISGSLEITAGTQLLNAASIDAQAKRVAQDFTDGSAFRNDPVRVLELIRKSAGAADATITANSLNSRLSETIGPELKEELRKKFNDGGSLTLRIEVPVTRNGKSSVSYLDAALGQAPHEQKPADLFFREGMCLPEVTASSPADVDLVVRSASGELATYLNFCEGKAHLGLNENEEVKAKLRENGFSQGVSLKRFVRRLMADLRAIVLPDADKPDATAFSSFFSVSKPDSDGKKSGTKGVTKPDQPPPPKPEPVAPKPRIFIVDELEDGFRIRGNPAYEKWPVKLRAEVAYADGTRRPRWSKHDFQFERLALEQSGGGKLTISKNQLTCEDCTGDFTLEVRGFDGRRELVTNIRAVQNA